MPTTKVYGCGGIHSAFNFFPCTSCCSRNNPTKCAEILKRVRTIQHMEYYSDSKGHSWRYNRKVKCDTEEVD